VSVLVDRLSIIGVGLIGGSFGLALKDAAAVGFVTGCGRNVQNLRDALGMGAIDDATTDPAEAVKGADLVMIAVPVRSTANIAKKIGPHLKNGAVVIDAGSTKEIVTGELVSHLPPYVHVVPSHPIAGSEKTGAIAAEPDLFKDRRTIITPGAGTDPAAVELVKRLWEAAGSRVEVMEPGIHDTVMGAVSHLPHLVAYALVETLMEWDDELPMLRFSAGGLRDFTRIASSSPEMWRDICLDNKGAILQAVDRFIDAVNKIRSEVEAGDGEALHRRFERAREVREQIKREDE